MVVFVLRLFVEVESNQLMTYALLAFEVFLLGAYHA